MVSIYLQKFLRTWENPMLYYLFLLRLFLMSNYQKANKDFLREISSIFLFFKKLSVFLNILIRSVVVPVVCAIFLLLSDSDVTMVNSPPGTTAQFFQTTPTWTSSRKISRKSLIILENSQSIISLNTEQLKWHNNNTGLVLGWVTICGWVNHLGV